MTERLSASLKTDSERPSVRIRKAVDEFLNTAVRRKPEVLHHYTASADAVINIIETGNLFATHARFLNDVSELSYGHGIIMAEVRQRARREKGAQRLFIEHLRPNLELYGSFLDVYVSCFCASTESLSQWQAYAARGEGYDLVFDRASLEKIGAAYLARVEYRPAYQRRCVNVLLDSVLEGLYTEIKGHLSKDRVLDEAYSKWRAAAEFALLAIVPLFKDPRFKAEAEWRLVQIAAAEAIHKGICFRASASAIIPYVPLNLRSNASDPSTIPLLGIRFLQISGGEARQRALEMLLRHRGISATVGPSALPLRAQ